MRGQQRQQQQRALAGRKVTEERVSASSGNGSALARSLHPGRDRQAPEKQTKDQAQKPLGVEGRRSECSETGTGC